MPTTQPPPRPHNVAHNVYYIGLWFTIFFGGLALIMMLRQQGLALASNYELQATLDDAVDKYNNGRITESQRSIIGVIETQPELAPGVVDKLGPKLLGMPKAYEAVTSGLSADGNSKPVPGSDEEQARLQSLVTLGQAEEAVALLEARVRTNPNDRDAHLWIARVSLEHGDFAKAREHFELYWKGRAKPRQELVAAIFSDARIDPQKLDASRIDTLAETFEQMVWAGLWDEAAKSAKALPDEMKRGGLEFYEAILLDALGKRQEAANVYARVLQHCPSHHLSALGLARVTPSLP
jgi:tetratricopeptide (TPR) repeat protein